MSNVTCTRLAIASLRGRINVELKPASSLKLLGSADCTVGRFLVSSHRYGAQPIALCCRLLTMEWARYHDMGIVVFDRMRLTLPHGGRLVD